MACMFNRNLFICLNRRKKNKEKEKTKKNSNIKMDGLVMQMIKEHNTKQRQENKQWLINKKLAMETKKASHQQNHLETITFSGTVWECVIVHIMLKAH